MPNAKHGIERATARHRRRPLLVQIALPIDEVALSDGVMQSASCCHYKPSMPIGWPLFPKPCWAVLPPRRSKPSLSSISPISLASNHLAATAAISNANGKMVVSVVGKNRRWRCNDPDATT
jgi:hypothetical protein